MSKILDQQDQRGLVRSSLCGSGLLLPADQSKQPSLFWGVFHIVVSSVAAGLVAILFIVVYVALSELHRELAIDVHAVLKVSNELLTEDLIENALWMLDGTVACICLFLILEDAFILYELNCELHRLNSEAYLSLREALDVDNRYIKDAIILEAAEAQEAMAEMKSAIQCKEESITPKSAPAAELEPITSLMNEEKKRREEKRKN